MYIYEWSCGSRESPIIIPDVSTVFYFRSECSGSMKVNVSLPDVLFLIVDVHVFIRWCYCGLSCAAHAPSPPLLSRGGGIVVEWGSFFLWMHITILLLRDSLPLLPLVQDAAPKSKIIFPDTNLNTLFLGTGLGFSTRRFTSNVSVKKGKRWGDEF